MHNCLEDMVLMAWQSHQITNYFNAYKDLHFIDNILKVLMESTFSLFHNTCMHLRVCQNLELIHIFSVFSQKILKRKKIKQHPFSCNTKLKLNPPYGVSFQFGPNWVSHPEKKMRSKLEGEFFGGMCKHSAGTRALHSYQCGLGFYSSHQCHYTSIWLGFVVDSLLCSTSFFSRCSS